MNIHSKASSLSRAALLCAVLGASSTHAQAFFVRDDRPPPNGSNGLSLNGLSLNGLSANGLSANGRVSQSLKFRAVILAGERVPLR